MCFVPHLQSWFSHSFGTKEEHELEEEYTSTSITIGDLSWGHDYCYLVPPFGCGDRIVDGHVVCHATLRPCTGIRWHRKPHLKFGTRRHRKPYMLRSPVKSLHWAPCGIEDRSSSPCTGTKWHGEATQNLRSWAQRCCVDGSWAQWCVGTCEITGCSSADGEF